MTADELKKIADLFDRQPVPTDHRMVMKRDGQVVCLTCRSSECTVNGALKKKEESQ